MSTATLVDGSKRVGDKLMLALLASRWSTRFLVLGIAVLAFMLMNTSPAFAADPDAPAIAGTGKTHLRLLMEADSGSLTATVSNFLPYMRWYGTVVIPVPATAASVFAALPFGISSSLTYLMVVIAGFLILIIGAVLQLATTASLVDKFIPIIDRIVYKVFYSFFGVSSTGGTFPLMMWIVIIIAIMAALVGLRVVRSVTWQSILVSALMVSLMAGMTVQTAKNHSTDSGVGTRNVNSITTSVNDPNAWTPGSLGWSFAMVSKVSASLGSVITNMTDSIQNGIQEASFKTVSGGAVEYGSNECGTYVTGMRSLYSKHMSHGGLLAKEMSGSNLSVQYDRISSTVLLSPVSYITGGQGKEMGGSWCRQLELSRGSNISEQVAFYVEGAKVTSTPVPYSAQMDKFLNPSKTDWKPGGYGSASTFFGPNVKGGTDSGAYRYYFGACDGGGKLRPGWSKVISADSLAPLTDADCANVTGFGVPDSSDPLGVLTGIATGDYWGAAESAIKGKATSDKFAFARWDNEGAMKGLTDGIEIVSAFMGLDGNSAKFILAGGAPLDYHLHQSGFGSVVMGNAIIGLITLVGSIVLSRYVLPMAIGAMIVQLIGVLILAFLPLILILAAIPSVRARAFAKTAGATYLASTLVKTMLVAVFGLGFVVQQMLAYVFGSSFFGSLPIIKFMLSTLSTVIAFMVMKAAVKAVTGLSITKFGDGVKVGMAAGAPLLAAAGMNTAGQDPTKRDFWMRKKGDEGDDDGDRVSTDENSPVQNSKAKNDADLISTDQDKQDDGRSEKMDKASDGLSKAGGLASMIPHPAAQGIGLGLQAAGAGLNKANDVQAKVKNGAKDLLGLTGQASSPLVDGITGAGAELTSSVSPKTPTETELNESIPTPVNANVQPESVPGGAPAPADAPSMSPDSKKALEETPASVSDGRSDVESAAMLHNARGIPGTVDGNVPNAPLSGSQVSEAPQVSQASQAVDMSNVPGSTTSQPMPSTGSGAEAAHAVQESVSRQRAEADAMAQAAFRQRAEEAGKTAKENALNSALASIQNYRG